ncbi:imidazole glycerol phosphate synthase subunit HisH [Umboniibacter marinipuniceus]|uniref:Imidazole glycerol phosphate synthase subunit HisH n=1 Tax=Umboniibacter marinipuniceus TaxID=569599 RepID=A0A3M0AAV5_9GAMM|nr:imidazole glycerol phosphate synthase subunit HisH [Umboniibacter marinipuniceus]RMA79535.1 glutamine amidotransferase [Umboniibacter marinipuniceus]
MIAIVDYGLGNIRAFGNIYRRLGISFCFASTPNELEGATHLILPGVGSFDYAMERLNDSGLKDSLTELVLKKKVPVLGICVGMQIMAASSDEGSSEGLGWLDANVNKFESRDGYPLPHMGWNNLKVNQAEKLFSGLDDDLRFYFLHSYHFKDDADGVIATATYSKTIGCVIKKENIYGIQCHPEKSHHNGVALLKNFAEL